jgi:hypothetical protein
MHIWHLTTILVDDDIAELLEYERRRRDSSTAAIVREALTQYLTKTAAKPLPFVGLGGSGRLDTARKAETILSREWGGKKKAGAQRRRR